MSNEEIKKVFTTLDSYTAGYLYLKNFIPELIQQADKIVFVFPASDEFYRELSNYNGERTIKRQ